MLLFRLFLIVLFAPLAAWAQEGSTPVIVAPVAQTMFIDEVEALGTLQANESIELSSTITEVVTAVNFEDGQRVEKGTLLVEMQAAEELAELTEAQSNLEEARLQLERVKPLARKGVASGSLLDERQRIFEAARARAEAVQSRVDRRRITAPFDGVVGIRSISVGALVQPGTLIATLDDDSVMKLDFSVPSVFLTALREGARIEARAKAFPDEVFEGRVTSVDSRVDPVTRSIKVRALIDNAARRLKPGLLMRVEPVAPLACRSCARGPGTRASGRRRRRPRTRRGSGRPARRSA